MDSRDAPRGLTQDVALGPLTTIGVGGIARWFVRVETPTELALACTWATERRLGVCVLGGGSNVVVADQGWPGLIVRIGISGREIATDGTETRLTAGAGEAWDALVADSVQRGLAGLECLSGIPGTVGAVPVQNVGAYGQEVARVIESVTVYDRTDGTLSELAGRDCGFGYRMSRFKGPDAGRFVVCSVTFRLRQGPPTLAYSDVRTWMERHGVLAPGVADVREAVLAVRREKGMVIDATDPDSRSVGSFFLNPVVTADVHQRLAALVGESAPGFPADGGCVKVPAAWLIERAGFGRGFEAGRVGVSHKHPLAVVNRGGASASDIVKFAVRIKRQVEVRFGVALRAEPVFVGFGADPDVAYLESDRI